MKSIYLKPTIVQYDQDEIIEMMGPVRTQYPCDCETDVPPIIEKSDQVQVTVRIDGDCDEYEGVLIFADVGNGAGGAGGFWQFMLSEGTPTGGGLRFDLGITGIDLGPEGEYCFRAILVPAGVIIGGGGDGNGNGPQPADDLECVVDCLILR